MSQTAIEFVAALRANGGVQAIAGNRIHAAPAPEGTSAPMITYQRLGGEPEYTVDRVRDLTPARYQIDAWAGDYSTMRNLAEALRAAVEDLSSAYIAGTFYRTERELYDSSARLHRCALEFDFNERR